MDDQYGKAFMIGEEFEVLERQSRSYVKPCWKDFKLSRMLAGSFGSAWGGHFTLEFSLRMRFQRAAFLVSSQNEILNNEYQQSLNLD